MGKEWTEDRRFAVIIDAGSSGSRVQVYSWLDHPYAASIANETQLGSLPRIEKGDETGQNWMKKIHPGISSFADDPDSVGRDHLKKLYKHALKVVPLEQVSQTPVYLLATAGMRLLPEVKQRAILEKACAYTKKHTDFLVPECGSHFQVITGETEGLYGWISINYLLGGFDHKPDGKHHTYGFLDMGGASAQIAYVPNKAEAQAHSEDLTLLRLRTLAGETKEWQVFVSTWLGFGANEARRRYIESLVETGSRDSNFYPDPCLPKGLIEELPSAKSLQGTGNINQCLTSLEPLLGKDAPCPDAPCLFAGVHAPALDFDVNHFIGISEYYYSAHDVFGLGGAYDYHTLSRAVEDYCSRSWKDILKDFNGHRFPDGVKQSKLEDVCFKASWMMNVLHDGIGIPRVTKENNELNTGHNGTEELKEGARMKGFDGAFNSAESLAGTEVSWTMGKMLLYSSSGVVPVVPSLPVGFGPNSAATQTFNLAGELSDAHDVTGSDAYLPPRRQTSLIIIFAALALLGLLLLRNYRRNPVLYNFSQLWTRSRRKVIGARGDQSYERVLEDGELEDENRYEMGRMSLKDLNKNIKPKSSFSNGLSRSASQMRLHRTSREGSEDGKLA